MSKQFSELSKNNIIGNVHIHDNFGYHDEHLSPGEGNVPIEEFVQKLEKSGYTGKYIAEVGGQKEGFHHTSWTGAMNVLNSPVYRVDNQYARWSDIERSYFGSVPQSPGFLVGDMVPSKDWTLWSEVGLEYMSHEESTTQHRTLISYRRTSDYLSGAFLLCRKTNQ